MSAGQTEELAQVGEGMCNDLLIRTLNEFHPDDMPAGGFVVKLARVAPISQLRERLAVRLEVPVEGISFAFEGRELDNEKTIAENGIVEPGPAARRAGTKVTIIFMLADGVELGAVLQRRERDRQVQEEENAERRRLEQEARERAAKAKQEEAEAKAKEEAAARAEAEAKQQEAAMEADRCVVQCAPLGDETNLQEVRTSKSATVIQLAQQISEQQGMRSSGGILRLTCNGNELVAASTLRASNIEEGAEIYYYWEAAHE